MLELSARQHEYIMELATGPKTSQEIAQNVGICDGNVSKRVVELRAMGVVKSTWVTSGRCRIYVHSLIRSYEDMVSRGFVVRHYNRTPITEANLYYAAILTNGGFTGMDRLTQYQKVFPDRSLGSLKNILRLAGRRHIIRR